MEEHAPARQEVGPPKPPADAKYLLIVCGMLLLIVVLLSVLWIRERRTSNDLRSQLGAYKTQFQRMAVSGQLAQRFAAQSGGQARPLDRDQLAAETVTYNGQPRTVLLVGAAAGRRMGLLPGDVIEVSMPPATAPTTAPATRTEPQ